MDAPKYVRLQIFIERLQNALPAKSHDEAYELLHTLLNQVENELTTIPFNPSNWITDGRMYPPQPDSIRDVPNFLNLKKYRSVGHETYISNNGAIEIKTLKNMRGKVLVSKRGLDGKDVWGKRAAVVAANDF